MSPWMVVKSFPPKSIYDRIPRSWKAQPWMVFNVLLLRNRILMLKKPENDVLDKTWILLPFRSTNLVVGEILSLGTWVKPLAFTQIESGSVQSIVGMAAEGWTVDSEMMSQNYDLMSYINHLNLMFLPITQVGLNCHSNFMSSVTKIENLKQTY